MLPSTITIDGPVASGKSTIGYLLARRLGYLYLDTGAMYRAVTWAALARGVAGGAVAAVTPRAESRRIDVIPPTADDGRQYTVLADGEDVTWEIRRPEVDGTVSVVSAYAGVRRAMVAQQRRIAAAGQVVVVGRDIGSVVLPDADLKLYLDASPQERARRRWLERRARGEDVAYEEVLAMMIRRDEIDSHRAISPLRVPEGAVVIDTTGLTVEDVLAAVLRYVENADP
ncbi:MAG: (d)CMP kinase [Anaerolineae bacterium]